MSVSDRREQHRQLVHDRILNAAREILLAGGIAGLTMRKLADKVGFTATNLYYHFKDKEAVLQALVDLDCLSLRKGLSRAEKVSHPVERLRVMGVAYVDFALKFPDQYRLLFLTYAPHVLKPPEKEVRDDPAQCGYAFLKKAAMDGLESGMFRPEFKDADELAQIIWAGTHGIVSLHLNLGHEPWFNWKPARATARRLIDTLLRGLIRPGAEESEDVT